MASRMPKQSQEKEMAQLEMLPAEIFETVARAAEHKGLLALRLTSKECASKVLKTYTKVHFTEILLRIRSERSLLKCLHISRHPVFRHALRTITISMDRCNRPPDSDCHVKHDPMPDRPGLELLFRLLARYTKITALRIVAQEEAEPLDLYPGLVLSANLTCKLVFMDIIRVLQTTPLKISSLVVDTGSDWGLSISEMTQAEVDCLKQFLLPLERLSLSVWRTKAWTPPELEDFVGFLRFLTRAKYLKHLSIDLQTQHYVAPLELVLPEDMRFPALQSLRLEVK